MANPHYFFIALLLSTTGLCAIPFPTSHPVFAQQLKRHAKTFTGQVREHKGSGTVEEYVKTRHERAQRILKPSSINNPALIKDPIALKELQDEWMGKELSDLAPNHPSFYTSVFRKQLEQSADWRTRYYFPITTMDLLGIAICLMHGYDIHQPVSENDWNGMFAVLPIEDLHRLHIQVSQAFATQVLADLQDEKHQPS